MLVTCILRALATACCWRAELRLHRASIAVGARSLVDEVERADPRGQQRERVPG